jgi:homogentisate 1,2-dioxygenase
MYEAAKPATDEYAVMLDARDALDAGPEMEGVEMRAYAESWMTPEPVKAPKRK